ncbi:ABC transporter ATP-binding protein [Brevibacterium samyangense]|uniref:ATP-binding cassette domain-containing protein n=1 Tax=Brevibacterium samyangense TaxID=366888 RepID=A0ABN2TB26_9MICO
MIEARGLTKRHGLKTVVDHVDFTVRPGRVTGFLGPNGAGKSSTMRMIMGLDRPSSGRVTVNGKRFTSHTRPLQEAGALLDSGAAHPGRTARAHLTALAATQGIPRRRVNEVLEVTGLSAVAGRRVGGFSLGMNQRLGVAAALLGDPQTLILDEPVNGLDPEGVLWVRDLARGLAEEGRTVFLSSHLMSEVALTADHVIVIGRGRILADCSLDELVAGGDTRVRAVCGDVAGEGAGERRDGEPGRDAGPDVGPEAAREGGPETGRPPQRSGATPSAALAEALRAAGAEVRQVPGEVEVRGASAEEVGRAAARTGTVLTELRTIERTLEEAYMELTASAVEYRTAGGAA